MSVIKSNLTRYLYLINSFLSVWNIKYYRPIFAENVDLSGQTAIITGANTGLGKEAAVKLAALNAKTIILCRDNIKADQAVKEIKERSGNQNVKYYTVDLADLKSVDKVVKELKEDKWVQSGIDMLMLNAGVMVCTYIDIKILVDFIHSFYWLIYLLI